MKFIILSDTHGNLSWINKLSKVYEADAVIHCGDFGFMSHTKMKHFTEKELSLNIKHSDRIPLDIRKQSYELPRDEKISILKEFNALGEFDYYLNGESTFNVPVYAIAGNHEDRFLVDDIKLGKEIVPNLTLLQPDSFIPLGENILLSGIGGNFALHRFFQMQENHVFSPFMTYFDWVRLYLNMNKVPKKKKLWLITHISPGKEPIFELFGLHIRPEMWFSGHMGAPAPQHYSLFTTLDDNMINSRISDQLNALKRNWVDFKKQTENWLHIRKLIDQLCYDYPNNNELKKIILERTVAIENIPDKPNLITDYIINIDNNSEFSSIYPSETEFKMLLASEKLLESPIQEKIPYNPSKRAKAHLVKGTRYFNLPDAYTGGFVVIEEDKTQNNGNFRYRVETYGHI